MVRLRCVHECVGACLRPWVRMCVCVRVADSLYIATCMMKDFAPLDLTQQVTCSIA